MKKDRLQGEISVFNTYLTARGYLLSFLILFGIFNIILTNELFSQWIDQYPYYTSGVWFRDIKFINKNTGWVCGDGLILKTTNMGVNWVQQTHPATNKHLYCIHPVDSNIVYCVGVSETILKTTNGGDNWFALRNGPLGQGNSYKGTFFINSLTGWIGGYRLQIYKTTDGGVSFDSTYMNMTIMDIHFKDSNTGIAVGGGGIVYKTTNQGLNWIMTHTFNNSGDFYKVSVINNQYCFVVENGSRKRVYRSTNYGDTWDSVGSVTGANVAFACRFSSAQTGWVGCDYLQLYKSTDGGATWNLQYVNVNHPGGFLPMHFYSDSVGWVAGANTLLLFTSTGGATFIGNTGSEIPTGYTLEQNYPNPFNSQTMISYSVPKRSHIQLKIYNVIGKEIKEIENRMKEAGNYSFVLDASELTSGIYFIRLSSGNDFNQTRKMILIK
ncbi:MAG TPA: T9SS type A sorting domain-containing protein [Ignavibacteria bacterium]|nr:T9SS type A sorting domain-containing protein [Ignavibacteria bacterium]